MNHFYVYLHRRNDTNEVFYVGKGSGRRSHSTKRNILWKRIAKKAGYTVEIISKNLSESLAYQIEETLITLYKTRDLAKANISLGGFGGMSGLPCPELAKKRASEVNSGRSSTVAKSVINIKTGQVWYTISEAALCNDLKQPTLSRKLNGKRYNDTDLRYFEGEI